MSEQRFGILLEVRLVVPESRTTVLGGFRSSESGHGNLLVNSKSEVVGESNGKIVSFRFVCAGVHTVWLPSGIRT